MKYTIRENQDKTYTLLRHGEPASKPIPNNAELEFWFRIEELESKVAELEAVIDSGLNSCTCPVIERVPVTGSSCPVHGFPKGDWD